jgi:hypothetical protein
VQPAARPFRRLPILALATGWGLVAALAFSGTCDAAFTQDDFWLLQALEQPFPDRAMFAGSLPDYVRPLPTWWFPWTNVQLFGLDARGHHLSMLVLHAAATATWFVALCRWTRSLLGASLGVAVYGLCEVHLVPLGWIAGVGDPLCALGTGAVMVALADRRERIWPLVVGFGFALLCKEHAVVFAAAFVGTLLVQRVAGDATGRADRRRLLAFAATGAVHAVYWLATVQGSETGATLGLDPLRMGLVLRHSVLVVHPTIDHGDAISNLWVLAPPVLAAGTLWLGGRPALRAVSFAMLLWIAAAALFAFTRRPAFLEEYYAHFSVLGLALLAASLVAAVQRRWRSAWTDRCIALLVAAHALHALLARTGDVADADTPSLRSARISAAFGQALAEGLASDPARHVLVLDATEATWWATGKGAQVPVCHPGVSATFAGFGQDQHDGASAALTLRQTGPHTFVRE